MLHILMPLKNILLAKEISTLRMEISSALVFSPYAVRVFIEKNTTNIGGDEGRVGSFGVPRRIFYEIKNPSPAYIIGGVFPNFSLK